MKKLEEIMEGVFNEEPVVQLSDVLYNTFKKGKTNGYQRYNYKPVSDDWYLREVEEVINDFAESKKPTWSDLQKRVFGFTYSAVIKSSQGMIPVKRVGVGCWHDRKFKCIDVSSWVHPSNGKELKQWREEYQKDVIHKWYKGEAKVNDEGETLAVNFYLLPIEPEEFIKKVFHKML